MSTVHGVARLPYIHIYYMISDNDHSWHGTSTITLFAAWHSSIVGHAQNLVFRKTFFWRRAIRIVKAHGFAVSTARSAVRTVKPRWCSGRKRLPKFLGFLMFNESVINGTVSICSASLISTPAHNQRYHEKCQVKNMS